LITEPATAIPTPALVLERGREVGRCGFGALAALASRARGTPLAFGAVPLRAVWSAALRNTDATARSSALREITGACSKSGITPDASKAELHGLFRCIGAAFEPAERPFARSFAGRSSETC